MLEFSLDQLVAGHEMKRLMRQGGADQDAHVHRGRHAGVGRHGPHRPAPAGSPCADPDGAGLGAAPGCRCAPHERTRRPARSLRRATCCPGSAPWCSWCPCGGRWYELRFPDEMIAQARAFSSQLGELGPFAQQGLDQLQAQGAVPVTAWEVFDQADAVLAAAAGVVLGLVLLNAVGALRSPGHDPDPGRPGGHGAGGIPAGQPAGPRYAHRPRSAAPGHRRVHGAGRRVADGGRRHRRRHGQSGTGARAERRRPSPAPLQAQQFKVWDAS